MRENSRDDPGGRPYYCSYSDRLLQFCLKDDKPSIECVFDREHFDMFPILLSNYEADLRLYIREWLALLIYPFTA